MLRIDNAIPKARIRAQKKARHRQKAALSKNEAEGSEDAPAGPEAQQSATNGSKRRKKQTRRDHPKEARPWSVDCRCCDRCLKHFPTHFFLQFLPEEPENAALCFTCRAMQATEAAAETIPGMGRVPADWNENFKTEQIKDYRLAQKKWVKRCRDSSFPSIKKGSMLRLLRSFERFLELVPAPTPVVQSKWLPVVDKGKKKKKIPYRSLTGKLLEEGPSSAGSSDGSYVDKMDVGGMLEAIRAISIDGVVSDGDAGMSSA